MTTIEIVLLIIAYSFLIVTVFLELICYKRNIESLQTIAFTASLLLLIIALTISAFLDQSDPDSNKPTNIFILFAMLLLGLTTPLNVLEERQHNISPIWNKLLIIIFGLLFSATFIGSFINKLGYIQYFVASFLGLSVLFSMILIMKTKPQKRIAHREKAERIFSIAFMILVPFSLAVNYIFENVLDKTLKLGFTLPTIFILLSGNKLVDDLQRLSIINPKLEPQEQHFKNFTLTEREKEMATLLIRGKTYKQISDELHISIPTVKTHAGNIYKKCGVNSRNELTALLIN